MNTVKENILEIRRDIAPYTPNIIAVTKYFDESKIIEAYEAGLRDFGEAKVIEAIEKIQKLPQEIQKNARFHLIGHLQSNKVKKAVGKFDSIDSVDSLRLAELISDEALAKGIKQKVLLQINNANEIQKFGFSPEEVSKDFESIKNLKGIEIVGLMNMAPLGLEKESLIDLFKGIVKLKDELNSKYGCELKEVSMGMSGDYKEALVAGATTIRIGRRLFSK